MMCSTPKDTLMRATRATVSQVRRRRRPIRWGRTNRSILKRRAAWLDLTSPGLAKSKPGEGIASGVTRRASRAAPGARQHGLPGRHDDEESTTSTPSALRTASEDQAGQGRIDLWAASGRFP